MLILSQDKTYILNLGAVEAIGITTNGLIYADKNGRNAYEMGKYDSNERAKEIVKDIFDCHADKYDLFEMPEK